MPDDLRTLASTVASLTELVAELADAVDHSGARVERAAALNAEIMAVRDRLADGKPLRTVEVSVERVNITEPDGTVRLIISSEAGMPKELMLDDRSYPHDRKVAGLLFFNDDGDECGGLVFRGGHDSDGPGHQMSSLAFDQLDQDQVIQLLGQGPGERTGLIVVDRSPDATLGDVVHMSTEEQEAHRPRRRLYAGKAEHASVVELSDTQGQVRIALRVESDGSPSICLYDDEGNVTHSLR